MKKDTEVDKLVDKLFIYHKEHYHDNEYFHSLIKKLAKYNIEKHFDRQEIYTLLREIKDCL